jgi:hypothetical protein
MALPQGTARIKSLGAKSPETVKITKVELIGAAAPVKWTQQDDALVITCPAKLPSDFVSTFKITTQS